MAQLDNEISSLAVPEQAASSFPGRRLRGAALVSVLVALMLTLLLEALDQTIVGTALPRIIGVFQGFDRYTWVITAYVLASTTMIPIIGKLSDQFGRKWFLISGTAIFLLGSLLSGASQTMNQLIVFRAIQGIGAGVGIALVNTVIADIFSPAERARWSAIFGAVYGFSNLIGPTVGGWLTDHGPLLGTLVNDQTRWRWVFYINLPVGILALAALIVFLPANLSIRTSTLHGWAAIRRIDFTGAILAAAATILLLLGLTWGSNQTYEWSSFQVVGTLAASGLLYMSFFMVEYFSTEAILPLDLFRNQVFTASAILSLLQMVVLMGVLLYLPFFLQGVLGESATSSGAAITPLSFTMVIGASAAGIIVGISKRYQLMTLISSLIMCVGIFFMAHMDISTSIGMTIIYMVVTGLGAGVFFSVLNLAAQNSLPRSRLGVGTAAIRYMGQLGATLGTAIIGAIVNSTLADDIQKRVPATVIKQLTPAGWKAATNPQVLVSTQAHDQLVQATQRLATQNIPPGPQHTLVAQQISQMLNQVFAALKLSMVVAIQHGMFVVLGLGGAMVIATLFLKDVPMLEWRDENQPAPAVSETVEVPIEIPITSD